MQIKCLTTFLEGPNRFVEGDVRTVDDDVAARLIANGWAKSAETGKADLNIQNVIQTTEVRHG